MKPYKLDPSVYSSECLEEDSDYIFNVVSYANGQIEDAENYGFNKGFIFGALSGTAFTILMIEIIGLATKGETDGHNNTL